MNDTVRADMLKITEYELLGKLPDPFTFDSGERMSSPSEWEMRRREIFKSAVELQYGTQPPAPDSLEVERLQEVEKASSYHIKVTRRGAGLTFRMQILMPENTDKKVPVIVDGDQCWKYHMDKDYINAALDKGVGWVFFDRTELAHDINTEGRGQGALYKLYPEYTFGAVGAWAWGYSRCVDALEKLDLPIDMDLITFSGHSRGGKTCALAGALDERAAIVNPNETCAGACGCYRIHIKGVYENEPERRSETLRDLWNVFSFWMGPGMEEYRDREQDLPFDAHFLKAMVAPRTLFISEAAGDLWANPVGSWQTTIAAKEVFDYLGAGDSLFWYFRPGFHGHKPVDVSMLVSLILHKRDGAPLDQRMYSLPFEPPAPAFDWKKPV